MTNEKLERLGKAFLKLLPFLSHTRSGIQWDPRAVPTCSPTFEQFLGRVKYLAYTHKSFARITNTGRIDNLAYDAHRKAQEAAAAYLRSKGVEL